jgi:hypothetical protein
MKWMLAGAAVAALSMMLGGTASASICSNSCDHNYSVCNQVNGGNAQPVCMPKWMQCKKSCMAPPRAATKVVNVTPAPKR